MNFFESVENLKKDLHEKDLYRSLQASHGLDFCSNDYLGLAHDSQLKEFLGSRLKESDLGSTGSRLLRGHSESLKETENHLASFCGREEALFFPSGYQANLGLFSCLLKLNATVFSDEQIHASIIDGIRLSGCEKYIYSHNSMSDLEMLLKQKARPEKLNVVVMESIYSMSGSFAPLAEAVDLCEKYDAVLIVDEAHATGLFGAKGSGRVEEAGLSEKVLATVHTAGKSFGVSGAWIAGSRALIDLLVNRSRPFIYSTAPAHYQHQALNSVLEFFEKEGAVLRASFHKQQESFQALICETGRHFGFDVAGIGSPITSLVVKDNRLALDITRTMQERGFDIRAIRPPTVAPGQAQIRITCPLSRTQSEINLFLESLREVLGELS